MISHATTATSKSFSKELIPILLGVIGVFAMIMFFDPRLALGAAIASIMLLFAVRYPGGATLLMGMIFYSNAAVVAVKFHGVPFVVGAAVPLLLIIPIIRHLRAGHSLWVWEGVQPFLLGYLAVQVAGAAFARDGSVVKSELIDIVIEGVLIYVLALHAVRDLKTLRAITWGLILGGVLMSIVPIIQQFTDTSGNFYGGFGQTSENAFSTADAPRSQFRLAGTIGEQNRFSQFLLMLVPLAVMRSLCEKRRSLRVLAFVSTLIVALGTTLAFSRGTAVAFAIVIVFMIGMRIIKRNHIGILAIATVLLLALFPQYLIRLASIPNVLGILSQENQEVYQPDGAIRGRATSMLAAARVFLDHPVVGAGPGMFKYLSQEYGNEGGFRRLDENRKAHSLPLQIAAENGSIGLFFFGAMLFVVGVGLIRVRRFWAERDPDFASYGSAYLLCLIAYLATGLFLHMSYIRYFWFVLGVSAAVVVISRHREIRWREERAALTSPRALSR